jgi:hypothetical protein
MDDEFLTHTSETMIRVVMVHLMVRRLPCIFHGLLPLSPDETCHPNHRIAATQSA